MTAATSFTLFPNPRQRTGITRDNTSGRGQANPSSRTPSRTHSSEMAEAGERALQGTLQEVEHKENDVNSSCSGLGLGLGLGLGCLLAITHWHNTSNLCSRGSGVMKRDWKP